LKHQVNIKIKAAKPIGLKLSAGLFAADEVMSQ